MSKFRSFTKEMKKRLSTDVKGFTLIEVIVVLVILAILMAIAIPNVLGYINKAKGTENELTARNIYMAANVESAEILKSQSSITETELQKHINNIQTLANITSTEADFSITAATDAKIAVATGTDSKAKVVIILKSGMINGVQYSPIGDTDGAKCVNYYANGTIETGAQYDPTLVKVIEGTTGA